MFNYMFDIRTPKCFYVAISISQVFFKVEILFPSFFCFFTIALKMFKGSDLLFWLSQHSLGSYFHGINMFLCHYDPCKMAFWCRGAVYPRVTWLCLMRRLQMRYIKQHIVSSYLLVMSAVIIDYSLDLLICWGLKMAVISCCHSFHIYHLEYVYEENHFASLRFCS